MVGVEALAVAATYKFGEGIRITRHPAVKTNLGYVMQDDGEWVYVSEVNEDPFSVVSVVEPEDASLVGAITEEVRQDLWCRLAGYGII